MRSSAVIACLALIATAAPAQDTQTRAGTPALTASVAGGKIVFEVRAAPHTQVAIAVATALAQDGKTLAIEDPLFIASSIQPSLRGSTGADGIFRTTIPLDPKFEGHIGSLHAQAASLDSAGAGVRELSNVAAVSVEPRELQWTPMLWGLGIIAAAALLAVLVPAAARGLLARACAAAALAAAPFLLARAYWPSWRAPPFLPYGGEMAASLDAHLGPSVHEGFQELNGLLPATDAVVFVEFPLALGDDLLLHRLFAKRPYFTIAHFGLLNVVKARGVAHPVVVTVGKGEPPAGSEIVYRNGSLVAWREPS